MSLGEKIKGLRKESGWSQDELARKIDAIAAKNRIKTLAENVR